VHPRYILGLGLARLIAITRACKSVVYGSWFIVARFKILRSWNLEAGI